MKSLSFPATDTGFDVGFNSFANLGYSFWLYYGRDDCFFTEIIHHKEGQILDVANFGCSEFWM